MTDQFERYDYAYWQRGWTTQDPTLPVPPVFDMSGDVGLPDDVNKVIITGEFEDPFSGRDVEGVLDYRISDILVYTTTNTEVMPSVRTVRFTEAQPLSISVPATDNTTLISTNPDGWLYYFRLTVQGVARVFSSTLPSSPGTVAIWDLIGDQA